MVGKEIEITWTETAQKQLTDIYGYIKRDSVQNAAKVRDKMVQSIESIPKHPLKHNPDKLKQDNDGTFRAYEIYRYRIMYEVTEDSIIIHRISHATQEPKRY